MVIKLDDLPVEVLSNTVHLLAPPFYAQNEGGLAAPASPSNSFQHRFLDPKPAANLSVPAQISLVSRTSHALLEAARPWLWENVEVQTGRGWLAVVNALTEEVADDARDETLDDLVESTIATTDANTTSRRDESPSSAQAQPHPTPSTSFASPLASQPLISPVWSSPFEPTKVEGLSYPSAPKSILTSSPILARSAKIRARSRSPRRSIGFMDEGIQAVLSRGASSDVRPGPSRSGSANSIASQRPSFVAGRRTSLSNVHTRPEAADEEELEDQATGGDWSTSTSTSRLAAINIGSRSRDASTDSRILTPPRPEPPGLPPAAEEHWLNCNPELLPPPGPYIRHLSFVNFRTIGSRRTQDEAVRGRFVTGGRLEGVLKNAPNLVSLCMTEYVDSALSFEVIEEILFRGTKRPRKRRRMSSQHGSSLSRIRSVSLGPSFTTPDHDQLDPPRPVYVPYEDETEEQRWRRRGMFSPLQALDLTGCVSRVFQDGLKDFWELYFAPEESEAASDEESGADQDRGRGRTRTRGSSSAHEHETETEDEGSSHRKHQSYANVRTPTFPHFRRLSLRGCLGIDHPILDSLLPAFTSLTHLDLSNTKVSSSYLSLLIHRCPRSLRLTSLSLARCPRLDPYTIVQFLCRSPAVADLRELNLYVNLTQGNPIRSDDLMQLITTAPCFKSGRLRYLDLSSAMFTADHLAIGTFPPQPSLVSLGLSHIPSLPLPPVAAFLLNQAPNVEVLTLVGTAADTALRPANSSLQLTLELHARLVNPLTTVPFSMADLSLDAVGRPPDPGPSRLRVIELSLPVREAIGTAGGSHEWKIVRSKGGRGWYVDVSAGWVEQAEEDGKRWLFARHLPSGHPWRRWMMGLNQANGKVGSGVGWHSRKMEVIRGYGMLGREEGLAGAGAFAFEE